MIVYIAAPYSRGDVAQNVHNVIKVANAIIERGHTPYIPHLTHFWHLITPKPYEFWLDYDLKFLPKCDCLLRTLGASSGGDVEVEEARKLGVPVYYKIKDIPDEN